MRTINRQREQGIALLLSILCLLLLTAIAAGMMYLSATETAINANFKSEESAYFAARAGVEEVRDRILPANANTINASLPTALPSGTGGVVYVLNGVSGSNITNSTSPYFDDELCMISPQSVRGLRALRPTSVARRFQAGARGIHARPALARPRVKARMRI